MVVNRREIQEIIIAGGLMPVFNHDDPEISTSVLSACYKGGLRVFEWTNRGDKAMDIFTIVREICRTECPGMRLGVGSILDVSTADMYISKGAEFVVSPVFDPELANFARDAKFTFIPGCGSVTEIHQAQKYGAKLVKMFPGEVLGPGFIKSVLGPMPWSEIMPTGGVSRDKQNLKAWFDAGAKCVGMGSQLFSNDLLNPEGMGEIEERVREVLTTIKGLRTA